jgi:glucose/arabinose dehydrogenase
MTSLTKLSAASLLALTLLSCGQNQSEQASQDDQANAGMASAPADPNAPQLGLQKIAEGVTSPVAFAHAGDGSGRIFIVEQPGRILVMKNGKPAPKPFLDLAGRVERVGENYSEKGLLGLAFHPDYEKNGRFFVYYSSPARKGGVDHVAVLAEYKASGDQAQMTRKYCCAWTSPSRTTTGANWPSGPTATCTWASVTAAGPTTGTAKPATARTSPTCSARSSAST